MNLDTTPRYRDSVKTPVTFFSRFVSRAASVSAFLLLGALLFVPSVQAQEQSCQINLLDDIQGLAAGTVISGQISGVTVSTDADFPVMVFDSANPTGGDFDLGTPNEDFAGPGIGAGGEAGQPGENNTAHGKIMIISEDGDGGDPDDSSKGGTITFAFDHNVHVNSILLVDVEDALSSVTLYDADNNVVASATTSDVGDNGIQELSLDAAGVRLEVFFRRSGGLGRVNMCNKADLEVDISSSQSGDVLTLPIDVRNNPNDGVALKFGGAPAGDPWFYVGDASGVQVKVYRASGDFSFVSSTTGCTSTAGFDVSVDGEATLDIGGLTLGSTVNLTLCADIDPDAASTGEVLVEVTAANECDPDSEVNNLNFEDGPQEDDEDTEILTNLPVELVSFDATLDGASALLQWQTASELNNAGFEIQHRYLSEADKSGVFETLGFMDGFGTTEQAQSYSFRASALEPGQHVFRLKQVDYDGTFAYSPEVEVVVEMPDAFIVNPVYPNPFNPQATFSFAVKQSQEVRVELFNMLGQRVQVLYRGTPAAGEVKMLTIDGTNLLSGAYLLRVQGAGFMETQSVTLVK